MASFDSLVSGICRNRGKRGFDMVSNHAEDPTGAVPWPTIFRTTHRAVRPMVLAVLPDATDLEEMMAERGLGVDHSTIGRWVLRYAPELHKRIRRDTRNPNRS